MAPPSKKVRSGDPFLNSFSVHSRPRRKSAVCSFANWSWLRTSIAAASVLLTICVFPSGAIAQKTSGLLASAARMSEYVIQGAVNDERVEFLLQQSASSNHQDSRLIEALSEESAAWNALLDSIQVWKPTPQEIQQHIPQRLAQLVLLAHNSLLQSAGTIKKSPHYTWLAGRLNSSLAKVNALQEHLKRLLAPQFSPTSASKTSTPPTPK
jgi:hypothetical protein